MAFWNKRASRLRTKAKPGALDKASDTAPAGTAHLRPVTPWAASPTPQHFGALALEGYGRNVVVFRAVNLVARAVSSLPVRLRKGGQIIDRHPALDLLAAPHPERDHTAFIYQLVGDYLIAGNAYILAAGPKGQPPGELWPLRPDTVTPIPGAAGLVQGYSYRAEGAQRRYPAASVLHWKTYNPLSAWLGMAPLSAAATAVDQHNAGSRWNLALIQNGGTPSGVLYQDDADNPLSPEQFAALRDQVDARHTGPDNAGRPLLLEGGLKWQSMGMTPKDLDWLAAQHMSAREIALAFGVPPQLLGIPDSQTYANYAEARLSLWEDTVLPMAQELISALGGWLLPKFEPDLELVLDLDDVPALEPKRQRRFERITAADFLSDAEKRQALGFPPRPAVVAANSPAPDMTEDTDT